MTDNQTPVLRLPSADDEVGERVTALFWAGLPPQDALSAVLSDRARFPSPPDGPDGQPTSADPKLYRTLTGFNPPSRGRVGA